MLFSTGHWGAASDKVFIRDWYFHTQANDFNGSVCHNANEEKKKKTGWIRYEKQQIKKNQWAEKSMSRKYLWVWLFAHGMKEKGTG